MTERDYKEFFDDAPLALLRTDLKTGSILMANKFAATLLGCESVDELLTKNALDFYPEITRNKLVRRLKKSGEIHDQEIQMQANGKPIWVRANLRINCGGTCIECFLLDITEMVGLREHELTKAKILSERIDCKMASSRSEC